MKWIKRKAKNRRNNREHVLDVRMRSQHLRAQRVRVATTIFGAVLGLAVAAVGIWRGSEWALQQWVFENAAFNIRVIDVRTDGVIPVAQIRGWAGVKEGENLWATDLFRVRRDLELQPLIQSASVERVLPNTLKIRVIEREPIAQITGFQVRDGIIHPVIHYLDEAGYVMLPLESAEAILADPLPTLTGVMGTELRPGKKVESPQLHAALKFVAAFIRSPMAGVVDLKAIDVSTPHVLKVTSRQGNEITVALQAPERQLQRWRVVHDFALQQRKAIASLDLSVSNNVPARWQESEAVSVPAVQPKKPSRYRKKHV